MENKTTTTNAPRTGEDAQLSKGDIEFLLLTACDQISKLERKNAALVAALEEAQANLHSYQAYAEAMREHGRGHVPLTGKRGFGPEGLNSFIAAALAAARNP